MIEILIVEDEPSLRELMQKTLQAIAAPVPLMVWRQQTFWRREILT